MIRRWLPDVTAGLLVSAVGAAEFFLQALRYGIASGPLVLVFVGTAGAVTLCRHLPGAALTLVWLIALGQAATGTPVVFTQVAVAAVAFGTARWGRPGTLWLGLVSVPVGAMLAVLLLDEQRITLTPDIAAYARVVGAAARHGLNWRIVTAVIGTALLGSPWLAGLALRVAERARVQSLAAEADLTRVQAEREQAQRLAQMREESARLARDVHDVVGHSLAVILAQAESGQYLADDDPAALKRTLATIAVSARTSLRDVRQVLSATRDADGPGGDDLDALVDGLRTGGHRVVATQLGTARPLPPEQAVTAFRVLQEMFTNVLRHGRRDATVTVLRQWTEGDREAVLMIEVTNGVDPDRTADAAPGRGLTGMRQRLAAVGGRLEVRREPDTFTVTARIPVRS